ncbi:uncharacterized protein BDW70DRAFT_142037 [Aspergillus foveolatus]|uniref:uncharacterized protein n=1 Tax=Aspergillus foveolatus TaxID=210207 RepID=UPI003CCD5822
MFYTRSGCSWLLSVCMLVDLWVLLAHYLFDGVFRRQSRAVQQAEQSSSREIEQLNS